MTAAILPATTPALPTKAPMTLPWPYWIVSGGLTVLSLAIPSAPSTTTLLAAAPGPEAIAGDVASLSPAWIGLATACVYAATEVFKAIMRAVERRARAREQGADLGCERTLDVAKVVRGAGLKRRRWGRRPGR